MTDLTPKQEAFALAFVETGNASEAYRRSYDVAPDTKPGSIWTNASKLLSDAKVSQRVTELQTEARAACMVTVGTLTQELEEARAHAMKDEKGASAAVSAVMGKAKLHGLLVERVASTNTRGEDLPPETGREFAREIAFALAAGRKAAG